MGISHVRFLNLGTATEQIGQRRRHPSSELLHEEVVAIPESDGRLDFSADFVPPVPLVALWISADGDDTQSTYVIVLNSIELDVDGDSVLLP